MMTPRERWLTVLTGGVPDRVPVDYRGTPEATARLIDHLKADSMDEVYRRLHIDPIVTVAPRYAGPALPPDTDIYGVGYVTTDYGTGTYRDAARHPLADMESIEQIEAEYSWPDVDAYDFSVLPDQVSGQDDQVIRGGGSEPFATYKNLRGVAQGYLDLIEHPDMVHYCLDKLYGFCYEMTRRIYETIPGKVIWTWVAEDLGTQEGLLVSQEHIREFFLPHMKRMIDLVHEAGAFAFHHSDGAVRDNIPDMIRIGADVLDPVQWRCRGMERHILKERFGDRLIFHGAMDNQHTLVFGSERDVRDEVADNIRILGASGGYILGPCHNVQAVSPAENIVAMYDAAYELGAY